MLYHAICYITNTWWCFGTGGLAHRRSVAVLCMLFKIKGTQCILWAMHCLCRMCQRVLLVVLWLLIGTPSRLLVVGLLSIAEPLCQSRCLFGTILVTLSLMVWAGFKSRANAFLLAWSALSFCFLLFYLLPSMGWLCGVVVFEFIECSHSLPTLYCWHYFNNNYYYYYKNSVYSK